MEGKRSRDRFDRDGSFRSSGGARSSTLALDRDGRVWSWRLAFTTQAIFKIPSTTVSVYPFSVCPVAIWENLSRLHQTLIVRIKSCSLDGRNVCPRAVYRSHCPVGFLQFFFPRQICMRDRSCPVLTKTANAAKSRYFGGCLINVPVLRPRSVWPIFAVVCHPFSSLSLPVLCVRSLHSISSKCSAWPVCSLCWLRAVPINYCVPSVVVPQAHRALVSPLSFELSSCSISGCESRRETDHTLQW